MAKIEWKTADSVLLEYKKVKKDELSEACQAEIIKGFTHTIDGVEYHFSFDIEAQLNFQGAERVLSQGIVDSLMWTVRRDGEYARIPITKDIMDELVVVATLHKERCISKYRDTLVPRVDACETKEEIDLITW